MTIILEPMEYAATRRAELADPNLRRCLIENCSTTCAVELVHVFSRETPSHMIKAVEWNWGMTKDSLNLDTRQNIFFLGASMHELYKNHRWALLPEESALDPYHDTEDMGFCILQREDIPKMEKEGLFKYRLLPIQFMDDIYLTRQSNDTPGSVTIHSYPFEDLPVITSHINPRYAILHLGQLLCDVKIQTRKAIKSKFPWLSKLQMLYMRWKHLAERAEHDPSFLFHPTNQQSGANPAPVDEEVRTPLCRIRTIGLLSEDKSGHPFPSLGWSPRDHSTSSRTSMSSGSYHRGVATDSRKRPAPEDFDESNERPINWLLTSDVLRLQRLRRDLATAKWTTDKISFWAQGLPVLLPISPPAPSHLVSKPHQLRRSARLLGKRKRG